VGLPRPNRLKKRQQFELIFAEGLRQSSEYLVLRSLYQDSSKPPSLGISISKKVSKKAVIRNRIKRQIRAVFRELLPEIPWGWEIVVVVKPTAIVCQYEHFLRELKELLIKAGIINGN
jgi:ribonuclease P protein component